MTALERNVTKIRYVATLAAMFPGLGHLYLGFPVRAIMLFVAFSLVNLLPMTRLFIPLIAIYSAWEAMKWCPYRANVPDSPRRDRIFILVGCLGFFAWVSLWVPQLMLG